MCRTARDEGFSAAREGLGCTARDERFSVARDGLGCTARDKGSFAAWDGRFLAAWDDGGFSAAWDGEFSAAPDGAPTGVVSVGSSALWVMVSRLATGRGPGYPATVRSHPATRRVTPTG
ncbi:hypothetical protein GCM10010339_35870 [Streptomyces alanosinicus]|uniref:Uncharacterized protein n=1 Tax=Streptomyces alanosinicus TaxID=68171 RepID=A0A918YHQ2_9ACTN|nr:hypothetical protein GCM10010339_35870 [Streptomyces alanosinicus]